MSGIAWAVAAGVCFGLFQAVNRRANQIADAYRVTFGLLIVGTLALGVVVALTQDIEAAVQAPLSAHLFFAGAGIVHFFFGWTFLSLSQQRVGAARTGAVVAATPLIGSVLAAVVLGESVPPVTALGVVLVTMGVALLSLRQVGGARGLRAVPWLGLGAALSWGTSPLFIRWGLEELGAPLVGVTIGLAGATAAYATAMLARGRLGRFRSAPFPPAALGWIVVAGLIIATGITAQWIAFDLIAIAVAISLMQLASPVVILVAPFLVGGAMERVTPVLVAGMLAVGSGSVLVALSG